jgi:hypothetical protein
VVFGSGPGSETNVSSLSRFYQGCLDAPPAWQRHLALARILTIEIGATYSSLKRKKPSADEILFTSCGCRLMRDEEFSVAFNIVLILELQAVSGILLITRFIAL